MPSDETTNPRFRDKILLYALFLTTIFSFTITPIAGADESLHCSDQETTGDGTVDLNWCARDDARHDAPRTPRKDDSDSPPTVHYITRPVESGVGYNCVTSEEYGQQCTPDANSCTTGADYVVDDDVVADSRQGSPVNSEEMVLVAIIRVDSEAGSEEHIAFDCRTVSEANSSSTAPPVVITVTQRDFASMPVEPLQANAGPPDGWLPVSMVNVLHADSEVQELQTELLDTPVAVRAIPTSYHWNLGDGNTITTTNPGKPYPSEEISAKYTHEGWYDITLTTTFAGQFSVDGGGWQEIDGTIEVTSEPVPIYSKSLESRLVNTGVPVDEIDDPWIPPRTPETEGPADPDATHREL